MPEDVPVSYLLPELIEGAKQGRIVYLSEHDEPVAAVVPLHVAEAGLAALGRADER
jgi:antitoxin (DNA-binding transcriptional repressor) of toxin-antitoxin stability system